MFLWMDWPATPGTFLWIISCMQSHFSSDPLVNQKYCTEFNGLGDLRELMHLKWMPQGMLVYCTEDNSFLKRSKLHLKLRFEDHKRNQPSQEVFCDVPHLGGKEPLQRTRGVRGRSHGVTETFPPTWKQYVLWGKLRVFSMSVCHTKKFVFEIQIDDRQVGRLVGR